MMDGIPSALKYRCVLVDEFQDFSTEELRFISSIPSNDENGLFLTGDSGQKIYAKDFDLPKAGIGPSERYSRSIRKNYRNSRQILEAAHALLDAYSNESTAKNEGITVLKPEYAVRMTAKPFAVDYEDPIQCAWLQAQQWISDGCPAYAVAIVTADESSMSVEDVLAKAPTNCKAKALTGDFEQDKDSIIVSDLNSVKGFEFSLVIIVGLSKNQFPKDGKANGEVWRDALRLYVAMTRARDELIMVYHKSPSPFLRVMADKLFQREIVVETDFEVELKGIESPSKHTEFESPLPVEETVEHSIERIVTAQPTVEQSDRKQTERDECENMTMPQSSYCYAHDSK